MSWRNCKVGDLCKVGRGASPRPKADQRYFEGGTIPWIKVADATASGKYLFDTKECVNQFGASFSRLLPAGSLIICTSGTLGLSVFLGVDGCIHDGWLYTYDYTDLDPEFFYYFLVGQKAYFESQASGAAIQNINTEILRNTPVRLPSLDLQARIVGVLKPYDDLIENNRRRIAVLQESARMLYREWFVHFRFPGHEHVKIIDGIPGKWERLTLADVAVDVSYGYTESASHDVEGPKFLRITDIVDGPIQWASVPRCPIAEDKLERFLLISEDIVVARTGATTGWARRVGRMSEPAVFASYLVRFRFDERFRPELAATYMQSDAYKAFVKGNLGGAAQPNAGAKVLANAPAIVPTSALQIHFTENVAPMFEQVDALTEQNQKLALARDLLLPRLMNGEIAL